MSLAAAYRQKNQTARSGFNHLAQAESARNVQNENIKNTRKQQKIGGAIQGASLGMTVGGPWGAVAGGALGLLFG